MKYLLSLLIIFCLAAPELALAAPKKKADSKAKVTAVLKRKAPSRAPASKKVKGAQSKKKAIAKKPASKSASTVTKGKLTAKTSVKLQASLPVRKSTPALESASRSERLPAGLAGLGLGSTAGTVDSNKSFEIRGQARTLSMMLILRNGKENVNFVKVRQDYQSEIATTEF